MIHSTFSPFQAWEFDDSKLEEVMRGRRCD